MDADRIIIERMLFSEYSDQNCSVARALEAVGERWTLLILREAFLGTTRFEEFVQRLGSVPRRTLSARLSKLVEYGIFERRAYGQSQGRCDYVLTSRGKELFPAVHSLMAWGDRWASPGGAPVTLRHGDGHVAAPEHRCAQCGEIIQADDIAPIAGPGANQRTRARLRSQRPREDKGSTAH